MTMSLTIRGATVALFMPNRLEYFAVWYGLSKVGVVTALINNQLAGLPLAQREAEAKRELERITALPPEPPRGFDNFDQWLSGTQLERELKLQEYSVSNRGLRPNLVGTPEQLRERIEAYEAAGLDLLLLQMSPQAEEMDRFAEQVIAPMKGA